jgi:hypothetical protein
VAPNENRFLLPLRERLFSSSLREAYRCAPRVRGFRALAAPASCGPPLLRLRPSRRVPAVGTPRCSHLTAPATPHRETPARNPQRMAASPEGRRVDPPPVMPRGAGQQLICTHGEGFPGGSSRTGGRRQAHPAGHRSDLAGACGPPTRRQGVAAAHFLRRPRDPRASGSVSSPLPSDATCAGSVLASVPEARTPGPDPYPSGR